MSSNLTNTIYNNELFKKIDLYHKKTRTEVKAYSLKPSVGPAYLRILPSETPTYGPPPFRSNATDSGPVTGEGSGNLVISIATDGEHKKKIIKVAEIAIIIAMLLILLNNV